MRVLHLPSSVAGMPWALAQGERLLGLESQVLYKSSSWLGYPCDICLRLERVKSRASNYKSLLSNFISMRKKFNVFHFNSGQSLITSERFSFRYLDLPLYPKSAKLFVTYNGCDARQKYPTLARARVSACQNPLCYGGICNSGENDETRRKGIEVMARYVKHIWAVNPDLLYFLPSGKSSFLPYAVTSDEGEVGKPSFDRKRLKIVHVPTDRGAKGSELIITTMNELKRANRDKFDFQLVENIPHREALKILNDADLIIDQILIGWYGGVAVESMSMGKPVICRLADEDFHFIPKQMAKDVKDAFIEANPENMKEVILACLEGDRSFLKRKSEAALHYAQTWHDPKYVASITKNAYESF